MSIDHKNNLGQFFTKNEHVQEVFRALNKIRKGDFIEPSVGAGDLLNKMVIKNRNLFTFEYDKEKKNKINSKHFYGCFFDNVEKIDTTNIRSIASNPPYVGIKKYEKYLSRGMSDFISKEKYKEKFNIAYLFMHKCAQLLQKNGEMIFIVPKDFTHATSALTLRAYLSKQGSFTHWIDCKENKLFSDADLESLVIFRWVKGKSSKNTVMFYNNIDSFFIPNSVVKKKQIYIGQNKSLFFLKDEQLRAVKKMCKIDDLFEVRVGSVTGCDDVFRVTNREELLREECVQEFVVGPNKTDHFINTMLFESFDAIPKIIQKHLLDNKERLLKRYGVRNDAWWKWSFIRNGKYSLGISRKSRIYCFAKTRGSPFVFGKRVGFLSSVYGLFPKKRINLKKVVKILNSEFYRDIYLSSGMGVNNKFKATPTAIKNIPFPRCDDLDNFIEKYIVITTPTSKLRQD